jgi:glycosyltransferase involved in cell wall biosynthesis
MNAASSLVFVWENFGPLHADRCDAVARHFGAERPVHGIELFQRSDTYAWVPETRSSFTKTTLFTDRPSWLVIAWTLLRAILATGSRHVFLCHYQEPYIFLVALVLRLLGRRTYFMGDSKFDDEPRRLRRERLKSIFVWPYAGALTASLRSAQYLHFLGFDRKPIEIGYDTISIARIQQLAGSPPAPAGTPHADRHFSVVARLIPEKNLQVVVAAMSLLKSAGRLDRHLVFYGAGPEEQMLREAVRDAALEDWIEFAGFVQSADVSRALGNSLAVILPSISETFGQVIPEAIAMGVPVIVSDRCGARDELVRTGVNGYVIEAGNSVGLASFMDVLATEPHTWTNLAHGTEAFRPLADVARFATSVAALIAAAR